MLNDSHEMDSPSCLTVSNLDRASETCTSVGFPLLFLYADAVCLDDNCVESFFESILSQSARSLHFDMSYS